ncbi:MAG: AAA family ATPase [Tropicimonas sp.]|uniref:AAA family ATPase n=1 Tax=Tropicimonas sp. TaxID=2067044 RepID=UPI003A868125
MDPQAPPVVALLVGLPGAGKTTLARALRAGFGGQIISRDWIRDAIFPEAFLDYSQAQNQIGTDVMYQVLGYVLKHHRPRFLIIDGKPFSRASEIGEVLALGARCGARMRVIHCTAPLETIHQRLREGLSEPVNRRAERTPEKATRVHAAFEAITVPHLRVDMTAPLETVLAEVAACCGLVPGGS